MESEGRLAGITESSVFLTLFTPAMVDDPTTDVTPLLQLGAAVMLDKPIILVVRLQDEARLPERLKRVADRIIVAESEIAADATATRIVLALRDLGVGLYGGPE